MRAGDRRGCAHDLRRNRLWRGRDGKAELSASDQRIIANASKQIEVGVVAQKALDGYYGDLVDPGTTQARKTQRAVDRYHVAIDELTAALADKQADTVVTGVEGGRDLTVSRFLMVIANKVGETFPADAKKLNRIREAAKNRRAKTKNHLAETRNHQHPR